MKHAVVGIISRLRSGGEFEYLLICSKRDFGPLTNSYRPVGGHLEGSEPEQQALIREAKEELGIDITPTERIAETPSDVHDLTTYWWRCEIVGGEISLNKEEIADARYFSQAEIQALDLWPTTKQIFEHYIFQDEFIEAEFAPSH